MMNVSDGKGKITKHELSQSLIQEIIDLSSSGDLSAENITITDTANIITATNVELALKEIMTKANTNATNISGLQSEIGTSKSTLQTNINSIREVL